MSAEPEQIDSLLDIMAALRDPENGCPWDIEQTFRTISAYTIEEAYEVADAIERADMHDLKDELGDLLFQVVFHAQMAQEQGEFDFNDVVQAISEKLVRRHPHVFADEVAGSHEELHRAWEQHKKNERSHRQEEQRSLLDGIASTMPALRWSSKLQKRAAHHGFDWDDVAPVFDKLQEEIAELKVEIVHQDNHERITDEMGDILFACVNLARHVDVNPEQALRDSNQKFIKRFQVMEQLLSDDDRVMDECSVELLEDYWQKAKDELSANKRK
ncbi:MAG: nucleoside triphosphate pyrophosphohydrolase [Gammaproteobacteria bacterium]|nr:nucleoside triphosphate pyrophosphohydrolase [Gammaproteobacteria bacterium]